MDITSELAPAPVAEDMVSSISHQPPATTTTRTARWMHIDTINHIPSTSSDLINLIIQSGGSAKVYKPVLNPETPAWISFPIHILSC